MKSIMLLVVVSATTVILNSCERKVFSVSPHPEDLFSQLVTTDAYTTVFSFDCREVKISPRETSRWVAFDISKPEWDVLSAKLGLRDSPRPRLKYATSRTPNDTGFQGYLDGEYDTKSDSSGRFYFVRPLSRNLLRIICFHRET